MKGDVDNAKLPEVTCSRQPVLRNLNLKESPLFEEIARFILSFECFLTAKELQIHVRTALYASDLR